MYRKLNQNRKLKLILAAVIVAMALNFVLLLPFDEVAAQNVLGIPFGGRIVVPMPVGYLWYNGLTPVWCPSHIIIANYGPNPGPLALFVPPAMPKEYYNYYMTGISVLGAYYPAPNLVLCPFYPIFYSSLMGTSALP